MGLITTQNNKQKACAFVKTVTEWELSGMQTKCIKLCVRFKTLVPLERCRSTHRSHIRMGLKLKLRWLGPRWAFCTAESEHTKLRLIKSSTQHKTRSQCGQEMSHKNKNDSREREASRHTAANEHEAHSVASSWCSNRTQTQFFYLHGLYLGLVKTCLL